LPGKSGIDSLGRSASTPLNTGAFAMAGRPGINDGEPDEDEEELLDDDDENELDDGVTVIGGNGRSNKPPLSARGISPPPLTVGGPP
jgi:hypothetical protein